MSKKRIVALVLLSVIIVLGVVSAYALYRIEVDVVSGVTVLNPGGSTGTALLVYHPGLSDFQYKVTLAFAEGLVSNGWRVEMTTASSSAPTNLSRYSLLVVGSPTYAGNPAPPIERYIGRLGNLNHKPTVIIGTAAGTNPSTIAMKDRVQAANGTIVKTLSLYTQAPNNGDPTAIAKQAGEEISPP